MERAGDSGLPDGEREEEEEESAGTARQQKACQTSQTASSWRLIKPVPAATASASTQVRIPLTASAASKSLSSQVMEYYQKYSQNSNLNQYFSLPTSTTNTADGAKYYYSIYELTPKYVPGRQGCIGQDYGLKSYIPKERKRWARPPVVGQSSSTEGSSVYIKQSMTEPQSSRSDSAQGEPQSQPQAQLSQQSTISTEALIITEEKTSETQEPCSSYCERKASISPTSSVASHKPLEWDSGADVGYVYAAATSSSHEVDGALGAQRLQQLSTLERMALASGCSAALRLDPEGTTGQQQSPGAAGGSSAASAVHTTVTATVLSLTTTQRTQNGRTASSTPLLISNASGSESEIEITPIVKNHLPGIVTGDDVDSAQPDIKCRRELLRDAKEIVETPRTASVFKFPHSLKYPLENEKPRPKPTPSIPDSSSSEDARQRPPKTPACPASPAKSKQQQAANDASTPLKKSSSMNLLASPTAGRFLLKRSQSELNLLGLGGGPAGEKATARLIFNSTSSIATVVNNHNRPATCDKLIQTSMRTCERESIGIQVSVLKETEKPPLPKRATSLVPRSVNSILKTPKSTYKVQNPKIFCAKNKSNEEMQNEKDDDSSLESSQNASLTPQADDTENVTGRANSFEYFPGHIYENVPNGSSSHVSSVDTGRSNSTMPNTSSSIDEKLWGDSDSLVRDLERSVSILKSLVDANKLDKQVKRRLIHHVVKRLSSAKYTDEDKIERDLEENVPWNPDDARNKIYRTEIIQALAKNTTDSSDDWKPTTATAAQKKKSPKKQVPANEPRNMKEIIDIPAEIESSNSDKFDRNTDRTVMDGRKARMGLRTDDCNRRSSSNTPTNKSESSECFLPQRGYNKNDKIKDMFITSTSNSSPQDQNRALLDAVVNSRRSPIDSSNEAGHSGADWRLSATASERGFEMRRNCSASDSADSKIVTYAELEKRNQLIWITNEISHLSKLKKLLEQQPKSKAERPAKSSPRKSQPPVTKPPKPLPSSSHQPHQLQNGDDNQLSRQWSSHCNLAGNPPSTSTNPIRRLKKRNSCTQTATDSSSAYSRTGGEIVSARIQSPNTKLASVCVQTLRQAVPPDPIVPQQYLGCPVHQTLQTYTCTCSERVCLHCRSKNLLQQHHLHNDRDRGSSHSEAKLSSNDSEDIKETKNQLNAKRLQCTFEVSNKASDKQNLQNPKKLTAASQTCNQHYCEDSGCSCGRCRHSESSTTSQSQKDCECENGNKLARNFERMQISKSPRKKLFDKASGTADHACQCKKSEEVQTSARSECSYHSNKKVQPYFLAGSTREQNRRECRCGSKPKDRDKSSPSPKLSSSANSSTLTDCKVCRVCGMVYQNKRTCRCVTKSYPKPVAYELSFVNDDKRSDEHLDVEINSIDRNAEAARDRSRRRDCDCGGAQRATRCCDCEYREIRPRKLGGRMKHTLQEYLITNNPGFADNVEIRRQYVSEIQRLRQLRKDKRVQLFAMATTTDVFTSPRPTKVTKFMQRKLTEEEMKERLRKRYFQLSDVRAKRRQQQLQSEMRCNKLMAKIFSKKLQQKVLKGQVDLSQSVSVISNI